MFFDSGMEYIIFDRKIYAYDRDMNEYYRVRVYGRDMEAWELERLYVKDMTPKEKEHLLYNASHA